VKPALAGDAPLLPEILGEQVGDDTLEIRARVPANLLYLEGHFSGTPVVAGVVQLAWAQHYARRHFRLAGDIRRVEQLKFQHLLRPPQLFTLSISLNRPTNVVGYRLFHDVHTFSSGRIHFDPSAP